MSIDKEWIVQTADEAAIDRLAQSLECARPLASVIAGRGYMDLASANRFLNPAPRDIHHPSSLPDVTDAVDRFERALSRDEAIAIYADRDIDGICGAAILVKLLGDLEAAVDYRVPGKWDGYGLHTEAVDELVSGPTELLVTVDCGTTAQSAINRARAAGLDVIVTDHHHMEDRLPDEVACVNPRRTDSQYPHSELAGGVVAFKLGQALVESHDPTSIEAYHRYALPLAALATLGDYMRLNLENRAIVREGYDRLYESGLPGLVETAMHTGVESMRDLSWSLVPLLNAAQEDESGEFMLELLLATDSEWIESAIAKLDRYREERRQQREKREEHLRSCFDQQVDPEADDLFLIETERYVGGLAMSRLSEEWNRPVITYRRKNGHYQGGGRSAPDVDFLELFEACEELLEDLWGHPGAAGFRVPADNLELFKEAVSRAYCVRYDPADFRPAIQIDGRLAPGDIDRSLVEELDRLQPFGNGNEEPVFLLEGIRIVDWEWFGDDGRHWKGQPDATADFTIIDWNSDSIETVGDLPTTFDIAGTLSMDDYTGTAAVTLEAIRVADDHPT